MVAKGLSIILSIYVHQYAKQTATISPIKKDIATVLRISLNRMRSLYTAILHHQREEHRQPTLLLLHVSLSNPYQGN